MKRIALRSNCTLTLVIAALLAAGPVASQPPGAGGGQGAKSEKSQKSDKSEKNDKSEKSHKSDKSEKSEHRGQSEDREAQQRARDEHSHHDRADSPAPVRRYFEDRHRTMVRDYYSQEFDRGHCPPGLAKKHDGCMPPGQAKKWTVGRPLPRDVIFYDLEPQLVTLFGPPPSGHRYVRVASDILLITIGNGMVVDSILDLGRM
ncbi:MAG TPA: hypothetical protein ENO14_00590 [Chromatiales bacterium]|nr:hypothetical protein [Chromatiales bacterium]